MASAGEVGPECIKYGISSTMLLCGGLLELECVTNQLVLELASFKDKHCQCTFKTLYQWLKELFGKRWPTQAPTHQAVTRSIKRLTAKFMKLKKQATISVDREENIAEFLHCSYLLPTLGIRKGQVVKFGVSEPTLYNEVCSENETESSTELHDETNDEPREELDSEHEFREEACVLLKKSSMPSEDVKMLKQKMYSITRNSNKRLKRRDLTISKQKSCIDAQHKKIKMYERKLQGAESQVSKLRAKLNCVNHRATYWRSRVDSVKHQSCAKKAELQHEVKLLKDEVYALDSVNSELNETIKSILSSEEIATFEGGKYTDDVRTCVYELLSLNVGVRNIAPIIRCVLKNIAHKCVGRLPSHGLTCQMILESLTVAQAQLGEKLSQSTEYNTLQTDGTTKYGDHFATYDVRMAKDKLSYTLGLRHVFSGSAADTLETFKEILDDIDSVQQAIGKDAVSAKIVSKIKNTMSDRHSAEKLFNELLHDYRAGLLPTIVENWNNLTDVERENFTRMNNFFCGLHYVVGLADCAEETLKVWEAQATEETPSTSSNTQRLIRTACKAFHHRGSQQCGSSTLFRAYLRKQGVFKIPLAQFVGNRFNIVFYDGAGVYYLSNHMIKFIENCHGKEANRLLQAVLSDLKNDSNLAGCRALGLVDKVVTGPLWRKLVESSSSILQMSSVYTRMLTKFDTWSRDSCSMMQGSDFLEDCSCIHQDEVWNVLIESNEATDVMTQELLQLLFGAFSTTTKRLLLDHLPGGVYNSVTDSLIVEETASVPTTNVAPERDFAILDRMLREKPNAHLTALEAMVLYSHNKASLWLDQKTGKERENLIHAARTLAPAIRKKFNERRQELERRRQQSLVDKQEQLARKELKLVQDKEKLTKEIEVVGLWMNRSDVDGGLMKLKKKSDKVRVLKLQINFRHKVLNQTHSDLSVFKFSQNRKQHSIDRLKQNLFQLLTDSEASEDSSDALVLSPQSILMQPVNLVGQRIRHRFEDNGELIWYDGTVLKMNSLTQEFEVIYDGEDDTCWYPLLEDLQKGDLLVLST